MRNPHRRVALLALVAAGTLGPARLQAQSWRTMTVSRQVDGDDALDVRVRYGAGDFEVRPGAAGMLYRVQLRYDEDTFDPVVSYDRGRLELGVDAIDDDIHIRKDRKGGDLSVELSREVPMSLDMEFGAVRADVDLGGLRLRDLKLSTGASESRIDVSAPNPEVLHSVDLEVGAADFTARRLGNLNAENLDLSAGVGEVTLDFSGQWRRDMDVQVGMGLGSLEMRFPKNVGVMLRKKSFLTSLDSEGLIKRGDAYYSPDYDEARVHITVDVQAAFGSVKVVWLR